jgi:hypothetical protein
MGQEAFRGEPHDPDPNLETVCPTMIDWLDVPHKLLVATLPKSVVITTLGKNHPLSP